MRESSAPSEPSHVRARREKACSWAGFSSPSVSVIALSLDRTYDTDEVLQATAEELGLTFPLARDPARTARFMKINMYPAFMIMDQAQRVLCIEVNGPASIDHFVELFDRYLEAEWTEDGSLCEGESCPLPDGI